MLCLGDRIILWMTMMDVPRILSQLHTDCLSTGSVHSDSEGAGDGLTGSSLVHRVCGCGSVDSCCCVKSTRPLHCRLLPTNKEILPGFNLSLLQPKTFCAIRSQWQRRWFSPRPTFCCPSSFVEAGSDWCVFEFWLNRTTNKRLFYTAGEYFGQLIFDVWNNKLFAALDGRRVFRSDFWRNLFTCWHLYWLHFVNHFWDGNSASTMNVLDKWLQVC